MWTQTYTEKLNESTALSRNATAPKVKRSEQRRAAGYRALLVRVPQPQIAAAVMQTAEQARSAKATPLYHLMKDQRYMIWMRAFDADVFATSFEMSREVVDLV
jgi:hypothetical protein